MLRCAARKRLISSVTCPRTGERRRGFAERHAESLFGADAEDDCSRFAHYVASREKNVMRMTAAVITSG
jgi:hypothetical protein